MSEKKYITNDELIKALGQFFSEDEVKNLLKAKKSEGEEEEEKEKEENYSDEDVEKAQKEYDDMAKAMEDKKTMLEKMKKGCMKKSEDKNIEKAEEDKKEEKKQEDKVEKAEESKEEKEDTLPNNEILKSLIDKLGELSSNKETNDNLVKAIEEIKGEQSKISGELKKIGDQPLGRKSATTLNFIEKGEGKIEDQDGNELLSLSANKDKVEKAIEDLLDSNSINEEKKQRYSSELIGYNAGGAPISKSLISDIEKANNCKLVK